MHYQVIYFVKILTWASYLVDSPWWGLLPFQKCCCFFSAPGIDIWKFYFAFLDHYWCWLADQFHICVPIPNAKSYTIQYMYKNVPKTMLLVYNYIYIFFFSLSSNKFYSIVQFNTLLNFVFTFNPINRYSGASTAK